MLDQTTRASRGVMGLSSFMNLTSILRRGETTSRSGLSDTFADLIEGAGVVAKPICVAPDAPILGFQFVDNHPDAAPVGGGVLGAFGLQHHVSEISDQALFGQK